MLSYEEFNEMITEIKYEVDTLDSQINVIPIENILNKIGFPKNWYDIVETD